MESSENMNVTKKRPLLSVLVAVYNIEPYIEECLKSICAQTYLNLQIIVVDDGSTDGSLSACEAFAQKDARVEVVHKTNGGLVSARKCAIEKATGDYALQIDGDDFIDHEMVEKMLYRALETDADVVSCGYECSDGRLYNYPDFTEHLTEDKCIDILEKWLLGNPYFDSQGVTKLCKRSVMEKSYTKVPDDCSYSEDWIFFIELVKNAKVIASLDKAYYKYRIRNDSLSNHSNYGIRYLIDNDRMMNLLYERISQYFIDIDKNILDKWYLDRRIDTLDLVMKSKSGSGILKFKTDLGSILKGKRVIIYGAGAMGKDILADLSRFEEIEIVSWIDKNAESITTDYHRVESPDSLANTMCDVIVVAIADVSRAEVIAKEISARYDIAMEKIVWNYHRERGL